MSQHNIIGSEAFDRRPFVLVRNYRSNGLRRRRASSTMTYVVVALLALVVGAVVAFIALAPQWAGAQPQAALSNLTSAVEVETSQAAPAVPGSSAPVAPAGDVPTAAGPVGTGSIQAAQ